MPACQGLTKRGASCKAQPLKGTDHCLAHSSAETRASVGFVPEAGRLGGRPRRPREIEIVQKVFEEMEAEARAVLTDGLTAERALVVGNGPSAHVEYAPDHQHRLATWREMMDRLHGKPGSAGDVSKDGVTVNIALITDHELRDTAADLRRRLAASRTIEPGWAHAGD